VCAPRWTFYSVITRACRVWPPSKEHISTVQYLRCLVAGRAQTADPARTMVGRARFQFL
jgi:hypothetical protein